MPGSLPLLGYVFTNELVGGYPHPVKETVRLCFLVKSENKVKNSYHKSAKHTFVGQD
jgi:hypothetical protein